MTRRELMGLLFIGLVIALLAAAFAWPWIPPRAVTLAERKRFAPAAHGDGRLYVLHGPDGEPQAWIVENVAAVPAMLALSGAVPDAIRDSLLAVIPNMYDRGHYPPGVQLFRVRGRTWAPGEPSTVQDTYILRDAAGDHRLGQVNPVDETLITYEPPLPQLPADLAPDTTITQTGTVISRFPYTAHVTIHAAPPITGSECRRIETGQTIAIPDSEALTENVALTLCDGLGTIDATTYIDGGPDQRITAVYSHTLHAALAPPPVQLADPGSPLPQASWTLSSFDQAEAWLPGPATVPATYVPGPDPLVLMAVRGGVISALSAQQPQTRRWTWQAGGDIYSTPTVDLATGRIYFGSIDRRLTALTLDGLFLWQQHVGDNIAASPLVVDDFIIVPSEDAHLYAFDAATGAQRWQQPLDSSSVARPAALPAQTSADRDQKMGMLVVSATDSGVVTAHHLEDGAVAWSTEVDGAVAAGLLATQNQIIVIQTNGTINALDAATGEQRWTTYTGWAIRFTPALGHDALYIHDENGSLIALDLASGRVRWQNDTVWHVGSPLIIDGAPETQHILSADTDGRVILYNTDGVQTQQWVNPTTASVATTSFIFGPTPGAAAYWMVDNNGVLWRLGPADRSP